MSDTWDQWDVDELDEDEGEVKGEITREILKRNEEHERRGAEGDKRCHGCGNCDCGSRK